MKIGDLILVYIPTSKASGPHVLEAALPTHLTRARGVVCDTVPDLVPAGEDGDAVLVRVEDIIAFRSRLAPVRPMRAGEPDLDTGTTAALVEPS